METATLNSIQLVNIRRRLVSKEWVAIVITFVTYLAVVAASRFIFYGAQTSPVVILTPIGIAMAAVILYGYRVWPGIAAAVIVSGILNQTGPAILLVSAAGTILQAVAGKFVLDKLHFDPRITRLRDMLGLVFVATVVTLISPTISTWILVLTHTQSSTTWEFRWLGGILSVIILTTLLIRWVSYPQFRRIAANIWETMFVFFILIIINFIIFWTPLTNIAGLPIIIVQLALFAWIALRMGTARMTLAFFITTFIGLMGPYFGMVPTVADEMTKKIVGIELYVIIFAVLFYVITAISEERDAVNTELKKNLTELEYALDKIKGEEARKNEFLAVLGHELRNPLTPIVSNLQIMELQGVKESIFKDSAASISRQVKNIERLVADLLDVSRISRGKIHLQQERLAVRTILQRAIDNQQPALKAQGHTLVLKSEQEPVWISADPVRLEQIFTNIISNAIRYTDPHGQISVSCESDDKYVIVTVHDTGVGIAPEMLPHIFDMFRQVDSSASRRSEGLGVGLGLVKAMTELHGGNVSVASPGLGKGSTFIVQFPKHDNNDVNS